jgi:predicted nucleic acid-binding protein
LSLFVVDASVVVQWFFPEHNSEAAGRLRGKEYQLFAPQLLFLELNNVLLKRVRRKEIAISTANRIRAAIAHSPILIHSDKMLVDPAYGLAFQTGCSLYDALYLALAVNLRGQLVTADRRLYNGIASGSHSKYVLWVEDLPKPI